MISRIAILLALLLVTCNGLHFEQIKKMVIKSSSSIVLSISLATSMMPSTVLAAEASKLFANAEDAIKLTQREYKGVEDSWASTKRIVDETSKNLGQGSESIKVLQNDFIELQANIGKFNSISESTIAAFESEIARLQVSTGTKFNAAQDSKNSEKQSNINTISKLYKDAENEANLLAKELENVKNFKEILASNNLIVTDKTKALDNDLALFATRAAEVKSLQSNGLALLVDGLNKNINACHYGGPQCSAVDQNGISLFRQGYELLIQSQDGIKKLSKDVDKDYKDILFVETQLNKVSTQVHELMTNLDIWETGTTLRTKVGKSALKSASDVIDRALTSAQVASTHFISMDDKLLHKNDKKVVEMYDQEKESVRNVLAKLESAERNGRRTENLMREAKVQGDKEAAIYLKYIPKSVENVAAVSGVKK